jgi:hypothetical protein
MGAAIRFLNLGHYNISFDRLNSLGVASRHKAILALCRISFFQLSRKENGALKVPSGAAFGRSQF